MGFHGASDSIQFILSMTMKTHCVDAPPMCQQLQWEWRSIPRTYSLLTNSDCGQSTRFDFPWSAGYSNLHQRMVRKYMVQHMHLEVRNTSNQATSRFVSVNHVSNVRLWWNFTWNPIFSAHRSSFTSILHLVIWFHGWFPFKCGDTNAMKWHTRCLPTMGKTKMGIEFQEGRGI